MEPYMEAWWGRVPSRCSCCKKVSVKVTSPEEMLFYCSEHGLVVEGHKEVKRGGKVEWHFYRLFRDYTSPQKAAIESQLSLF